MPNDGQSPVSPDLNIIAESAPTASPDAVALDHAERNQIDLDRLRDEVTELKHNRAQRKTYANRIFCVLICWMILVAYVVLAQGFGYGFPAVSVVGMARGFGIVAFKGMAAFHLSDGVIIALLTTATGSVIGVFLIVVRYIFPPPPRLPKA
jgi:hypothetical protein